MRKVAMISGASRGIGRAAALGLREAGFVLSLGGACHVGAILTDSRFLTDPI